MPTVACRCSLKKENSRLAASLAESQAQVRALQVEERQRTEEAEATSADLAETQERCDALVSH